MKITVKTEGTLLDYLYQNLDIPKKRIKQYLTHGSIYVNNNKTTKYDYPLVIGMNIVIDTNNKQKKELPFQILLEDDNLLIINKPSGLQIFDKSKEKEKSLYHIVKDYLVEKHQNEKAFLIHSQEKETSGIVIFAKNQKIKNKLQGNWNEYVTLQEYVVVIDGILEPKENKITQYLQEDKLNNTKIVKAPNGKEAITEYKVMKENQKYSLLEIKTKTNYKGQIKLAFASIKHPIVGDIKYGNKKGNTSRLYLHANRLKFYYPIIKKEILIETSIPQEFKKIVK